jgi:large subunit ribosomal protein L18
MAHKTTFKVKEKRRRLGITNKEKRLGLLKSGKPRMVARLSNSKATCQIIEYLPEGDKTLVNTTSLELKNYGYAGHCGNVKAAYLTGYLCAKKAMSKGIKEAILDIGLRTPVSGSNVFSALKGAIDAGLEMPAEEKAFPAAERLEGVDSVKSVIDQGLKTKAPKKKK